MTRSARLAAIVAVLMLAVNITPSWGQPVCASPGCNPTTTDSNANTAGGSVALKNVDETPLVGGVGNTAFGASALFSTTTGSFNTAVGDAALDSNSTGNHSTAVGHNALADSTGSKNTAIGSLALQGNTTGHHNTAAGFSALLTNTTGSKNAAFGAQALSQSTGTKNIAIGFQAGATLTTGNNNIYIGNQGAGSEFQTIRIGTAQTGTFIAGIANATVSNAATVIIDTTTGQLGVPLSSARYKQDIVPMGNRSEKVLDLRPVTFAYKDDARAITHYGLIAEEVATVYPDLVTRTASGEVQTVKYQELIPMLLNELQRQRQEFQQQLAELRAIVGQDCRAEASPSRFSTSR